MGVGVLLVIQSVPTLTVPAPTKRALMAVPSVVQTPDLVHSLRSTKQPGSCWGGGCSVHRTALGGLWGLHPPGTGPARGSEGRGGEEAAGLYPSGRGGSQLLCMAKDSTLWSE